MATPRHPSREEIQLVDVMAALGHPLRMQAVDALASGEEVYCGAIPLDAPKSTLTTHWRVLRESGVVHMRPSGRRLFLTLRRADLDARFPGLLDTVLAERPASPEAGNS